MILEYATSCVIVTDLVEAKVKLGFRRNHLIFSEKTGVIISNHDLLNHD